MGKKKKKWRAGGRCDASGQPRTNQCTLPLWSIHASPDYSRGTQISDPRATPVIIFLTQISAKQQFASPPPNAQAPHPPITVIVAGRRPQLTEEACQSFFCLARLPPSQTMSRPCTQTHGTLTPWRAAAPQISYAAEFLIGHIPLTSLTQGSRIDIEEAGKAQGLCTAAGMLQ